MDFSGNDANVEKMAGNPLLNQFRDSRCLVTSASTNWQ